MNIFKYLSALLPILVLMGILYSCSINESLMDTPTPELITNEDDLEAVIHGAYARFNDAAAFKFQGMMMLMLMADDLYSDAGSEFGPFANRSLSGVNTATFWNQFYFSIASANALLKIVDDLDLDPAVEKRAAGEAYFLRAFSYYYLVRLYGPVPLRLDAVDINSNFYLPRSPLDEVYAQIFDDLKKASARLPLYSAIPAGELGRASKGAAQALLAHALLTYGNQLSLKGGNPDERYTQAVVYADSVINSNEYILINSFADLFNLDKEADAYDEVIFGIRFQVDNQSRAQPSAGSEFALRFMAPVTAGVTGRANGTGAGSIRPMPWVADFYRTGDYVTGTDAGRVLDFRNEVSFYPKGVSTTGSTVIMYPDIAGAGQTRVPSALVGKYIDPNGKDERNNGNDFFVIRLAEIYLIKAEALNELNGPTLTAVDAFNMVRARARKANGTPRAVPADIPASHTFTKAQFRMKIFEERGLEFIGEGQRWFDLVRMQHPSDPTKTMYEYQFLEELPKAKYPKVLPVWQAAQNKWSNSFAVYAKSLNVIVPKFLLFPVPTTELLQNPSIGMENQNAGW
ncbi:RagB/SusD family nutrient uptake outer membrane protein [Dawidia soli]|uniref:RagB/SusD family nutrient uptake outer membrane protein n=1 Tax=Dawidia soli TaxID=2782352 RepID=A0AAP2DBQ9_9BACT|nr:RagB/SusD family nutrient uptake outer membrane protein [Dawidia soli]MBT1688502.1 RagB/SusD family nutrient uptake outer membrane protein [Dawidia soli]